MARRDDEAPWGLKAQRKGKFKKRPKSSAPPVEAAYVPPKLKRVARSLPDKTIEIFEGMTVLELAKRCGESIPTMQNILVNVGEKVDSEFDPLSIDIAELVAMVILLELFIFCRHHILLTKMVKSSNLVHFLDYWFENNVTHNMT